VPQSSGETNKEDDLLKNSKTYDVLEFLQRNCLLYVIRLGILVQQLFISMNELFFVIGGVKNCPDDDYLEWDYPGCGKYLVMMSIQTVVYLAIVLLIDSGIIQRLLYPILCGEKAGVVNSDPDRITTQDFDVMEESRRIASTDMNALMNTDKLIIKNLKKTYGIIDHFNAVKDISVGISEQECFGLLGQNGAGKTTTFKMLTGDVMVSGGNAYVNGFSVQSQLRQVNTLLNV
jgi:ATP-binding cassette subfamily A (ABC1) protein 3